MVFSQILYLILIFVVGLPLATAKAESNEKRAGLVKVLGSARNVKISLSPIEKKETEKNTDLCPGGLTPKVGELVNMVIEVQGSEKKGKSGKICFLPKSYEIIGLSSGRPPVIGVLKKMNAGYAIQMENGELRNLSLVSSGLKELQDKKVILDLKSYSKSDKEKKWKVVTYRQHP